MIFGRTLFIEFDSSTESRSPHGTIFPSQEVYQLGISSIASESARHVGTLRSDLSLSAAAEAETEQRSIICKSARFLAFKK